MTGSRRILHLFLKMNWLLCCGAMLVAQSACAADARPRPPTAYEWGACPFTPPTTYTVECGTLTVPENRDNPETRPIQLRVAVVKSDNPAPKPDPVVYLAGGPGGSGFVEVLFSVDIFKEILNTRDLVVLDQRGTGSSKPALACPEYFDAYFEFLGKQLPYSQFQEALIPSLQVCQERLSKEGIDLSAYNNLENATDVDDLRLALGYDKWNLLGVSYGTRLALTVLREFPEGVRSAILDSTIPPEIEPFSGWVFSQERAFKTMFEHCSANDACRQAYPGLEHSFFSLVDKVDTQPLTLDAANPYTRKEYQVRVDGDMLINIIFLMFYDQAAIPHLPKLIQDTSTGDTQELSRYLEKLFYYPYGIDWGMHMSVKCSDEASFTSYTQVEKAITSAQPQMARGTLNDARLTLALCEGWKHSHPGKEENRPVRSAVPTLVLSGEFDPVTPPAWGQQAAKSLKNASFYEFPGLTHGVMYQNDATDGCVSRVVTSFLEEPSSPPDDGCVRSLPGIEFVTP